MADPVMPDIEWFAHAPCEPDLVETLRDRVGEALPLCLEQPGPEPPLLKRLDRVEVSLVSDEAIARVHGEFMDDPTPTDVITFHHGEILVSLETARREAPAHDHDAAEEAFLYVVHGLLHLNGHSDAGETDRRAMARLQERIVREVVERRES